MQYLTDRTNVIEWKDCTPIERNFLQKELPEEIFKDVIRGDKNVHVENFEALTGVDMDHGAIEVVIKESYRKILGVTKEKSHEKINTN